MPERKLSGHKTTDVISADIEVAKSVPVALAVLPFLLPTPQMQLWDSIQISQLKTAELAFRSRKLQGASVDLVFVEAFPVRADYLSNFLSACDGTSSSSSGPLYGLRSSWQASTKPAEQWRTPSEKKEPCKMFVSEWFSAMLHTAGATAQLINWAAVIPTEEKTEKEKRKLNKA